MKQVKKILLSVGVILTFIAYSWQQRHEGIAAVLAPQSNKSRQTQSDDNSSGVIELDTDASQNSSSAASSPATNSNSNSKAATQSAKYKDGQYTGNAADAYYGYIQVKAIISGGKITDIQFLQYPNDRQNSVYINSQADPMLKQEAIQAQSAKVDIISGATDSSVAFIESLTNALNQAV
ncbi:MAG: FMN-binding protein [Candidatus Saccharimonadales bacterium]